MLGALARMHGTIASAALRLSQQWSGVALLWSLTDGVVCVCVRAETATAASAFKGQR